MAFGESMTGLSALDREQLAVLLGTVTRQLLERSHPDGLDSDDAQHVLSSTARRAVAWYEPLDGAALLEALIGALGVTDPDGAPPPSPRTSRPRSAYATRRAAAKSASRPALPGTSSSLPACSACRSSAAIFPIGARAF